jgi:hypothetical protein
VNRSLLAAAVATGILCGAWAGVAPLVGLSIWAGFAGCTAFFASGRPGVKGLMITISTTLVGVLTALAMIAVGDTIGAPFGTAIAVGLIVTAIVLMGSVPWLAFVPGIFVGCYSTFAINADWRLLTLSLVAGAALGLACQWGGRLLEPAFGVDTTRQPALTDA